MRDIRSDSSFDDPFSHHLHSLEVSLVSLVDREVETVASVDLYIEETWATAPCQ